MKNFIAGILLNDKLEVLLINRKTSDIELEDFWLLPMRETPENEDERSVLKREFEEKVEVDIQLIHFVTELKRESWTIRIYQVIATKEIVLVKLNNVRFFNINSLPERMGLESKIGIIDFIGKNNLPVKFYPDMAESLFSSIYYSYLYPSFLVFKDLNIYKELDYIINQVPLKKWKSALPFILSFCDASIKIESILAEILFAICTLHDDVCDFRIEKYGTDTVINRFGYKQSISSIFLSIPDICLLVEKNNKKLSSIINSSLYQTAISQKNRFDNKNFEDLNEYFENSMKRSNFLSSIWLYSLDKIGLFRESEVLRQVYPIFALLGQIINDYYDIERNDTIEDLESNTISYHTLLLFNEMKKKNRAKDFQTCWTDKNQSLYRKYIEEFQVKKLILCKIHEVVNDALIIISNSSIEENKKIFLKHYIDIQFGKYIDLEVFDLDENGKLMHFNNIINNLCFKIS